VLLIGLSTGVRVNKCGEGGQTNFTILSVLMVRQCYSLFIGVGMVVVRVIKCEKVKTLLRQRSIAVLLRMRFGKS
jgi:hypothetical protein